MKQFFFLIQKFLRSEPLNLVWLLIVTRSATSVGCYLLNKNLLFFTDHTHYKKHKKIGIAKKIVFFFNFDSAGILFFLSCIKVFFYHQVKKKKSFEITF